MDASEFANLQRSGHDDAVRLYTWWRECGFQRPYKLTDIGSQDVKVTITLHAYEAQAYAEKMKQSRKTWTCPAKYHEILVDTPGPIAGLDYYSKIIKIGDKVRPNARTSFHIVGAVHDVMSDNAELRCVVDTESKVMGFNHEYFFTHPNGCKLQDGSEESQYCGEPPVFEQKVVPGVWRHHHQGDLYQVLFISRHTETDEKLVNYVPLYRHPSGGLVPQSRPLKMWNEPIWKADKKIFVPRFKFIGEELEPFKAPM